MSRHLLLVHLGPVQEFIAQARRTRDLWYGSHLLSELSRAAARAAARAGASLIFPALAADDPELEACPGPLRGNRPPVSVANRILAEVPEGADPAALARQVRSAVWEFWRQDLADTVRERCRPMLAPDIDRVWQEQIDTFPEFVAAWEPLGGGREYREVRRALEAHLAARKALREFSPWRQARVGAPKSSLDGGRETVLRRDREAARKAFARYRIADGEQLDAVGLVKRAGGEPEQFLPLVNVAAASWLAAADRHAPELLAALRRAAEAAGLARVRDNHPAARPFPFDAGVLFPSRWRAVWEEQGLDGDGPAWGRQHVEPLVRRMENEPFPYVACLVADGDRVGEALDRLENPDAHRDFSRRLATFAQEARRIVEGEYLGSLVYAGGDDILAFLPLSQALDCANAVRRAFAETLGPSGPTPTLSVGVGIGHVMESMGDLLALGRRAEALAKGGYREGKGRDALAVVVDRRSGGRRRWAGSWKDDPVDRLRRDKELLQGPLSRRKVHEIARTLQGLPAPTADLDEEWAVVLQAEVKRSLRRVEAGEGALAPEDVGLRFEGETYPKVYAAVSAWVERMAVAWMIAQAELAELGPLARNRGGAA